MDKAAVGCGAPGAPLHEERPETSVDISAALMITAELLQIAEALQELEAAYSVGSHSMSLAPRRKMEASSLYQALENRQKELRAALVALE